MKYKLFQMYKKLKEFIISRPEQQKMLKETLDKWKIIPHNEKLWKWSLCW